MALDNFRTQKIIWDRANKKIFEKIEANSGDSNGRKLVVQVINQEVTEVLSGTTLSLGWKHRNGAKGLDAFNIVDTSKGIFEIYYTTEMLSNIGNIEASLILIDSTSRIESSTFTISVRPSTVDDESVESENSFTALTEALVKVNDFDAQLAQKANQHDLLVERNRINQFVSLGEGSTTGDAELIDGRIGADGSTYGNIGSAIRGQIKEIDSVLYGPLITKPAFKTGMINGNTGAYYDDQINVHTRARTDLFKISKGSKITATSGYQFYIGYYESNTIDSFVELSATGLNEIIIPRDCYIIIVARATDNRDISGEIGLVRDAFEVINNNNFNKLNDEVDRTNKQVSSIIGEFENLLFVTGFIDSNYGHYRDSDTRARTDILEVVEGTKITASIGYEFYIGLYDSDSNESFIGVSDIWLNEYVVPYDCYIVIVARAEDNRDISNELGAVSDNFDMGHVYSLKHLYNAIEQPKNQSDFTKNLIQIFPVFTTIGDSLTAGFTSMGDVRVGSAEAVQTKNNWPGYLELRTGRTFNNIAVGGSTTKNWRVTHLLTADIETNAYIVALGVNDHRRGLSVGTPEDIHTEDNQLNSDSFYGDYDYVIRELIKYNQKASIFVMTIPPHETNPEPYNQAIRDISNLYENVHLIDMYNIYYSEFTTGFLPNSWNGHYTPMAYNYESAMIEKAINNYLYENYNAFQSAPYG